ncbi:unnamed protein product, partial [Ectocarpus sp. 12 AP-2014]
RPLLCSVPVPLHLSPALQKQRQQTEGLASETARFSPAALAWPSERLGTRWQRKFGHGSKPWGLTQAVARWSFENGGRT